MRVKRKLHAAGVIKLLLLGVFIYVLVVLGSQHLTLYSYDQQTVQLREQLKALESENHRLQQERDQLNTPEYIEKVAREELGMVKKGETVFVPGERAKTPR